MAPSIVDKYLDAFDPRLYAHTFTSGAVQYELKTLPLDFFHRIFSEGKVAGARNLLEVGSGASVRGVISASGVVPELYLSDLVESARDEVRKWLREEPGALDCTSDLKHVAKLEGHDDYKRLERRLRQSIKGVLPCNVLMGNPLHPEELQFDVVTSCFCVDCIPYRPHYFEAVHNLASLVRPGGHVALVGHIFGVTYRVGNFDYPCNNLDVELIRRAMGEAGLEILEFQEFMYKDPFNMSVDIVSGGCFTALARKL